MTKRGRIHVINRRVEQSYKRRYRIRQAMYYPDPVLYGHTRNYHPREVWLRKCYKKVGEAIIDDLCGKD